MQNTSKVNSPRPDWLEGSRVILSPGKSRLFYNRHPWVFPGAIASIVGSPADGSVVALLSHTNKFVGWGIFNSKSKVLLRRRALQGKKNPVKAFSEFEFGKRSFFAKIWACWITNRVAV